MQEQEKDRRLGLLNALLITPHRELDELWKFHEELLEEDPLFYVQLAAWYQKNGEVRDHKELFIAGLMVSDFEGHREVGLALLWSLPPYQIARIVDFIKGKMVPVEEEPATEARKGFKVLSRVIALVKGEPIEEEEEKVAAKRRGLGRNIPRSMRTEIQRYLYHQEARGKSFERLALQQKHALKRLYAGLRIRPGRLAQQILFDKHPPLNTLQGQLKAILKTQDLKKKGRLIRKYKIPYRIATAILPRKDFKAVALYLVQSMTPQEVINNVKNLRYRGAFDLPEVRELILEKLEKAQQDKRVSTFKAQKALEVLGDEEGQKADAEWQEDLREALQDVTEEQLLQKGEITRSTALFIDKSSSMAVALELGQRIGAMIARLASRGLIVYAFDAMPYKIKAPESDQLEDWKKAFRGIKARGMTSIGSPLKRMRQLKERVEQIIIVTDGEENTAPYFVDEYQKYCEELTLYPAVIIVKVNSTRELLEGRCERAGIPVEVYHFKGDYYSLPNLIPLLTRPSRFDLLMEIMEFPLPQRPDPKTLKTPFRR